MGINPSAPNGAHHALMTDLHHVMLRYSAMPAIERVAILAQTIGAEIAEMPAAYSTADVLQAVAMNIAQGNGTTGAKLAVPGHG